MDYGRPSVDLKNPCYSPLEPASVFLTNLASDFAGPPRSRDEYLFSFFARLLYPSNLKGANDAFMGWPLKHLENSYTKELLSQSQTSSANSSGSTAPRLNAYSTCPSPEADFPVKRRPFSLNPAGVFSAKRKLWSDSTTFSDLHGPSKRMRSSQSINQSSFEVTKASPLVLLRSSLSQDTPELDLTPASEASVLAGFARYSRGAYSQLFSRPARDTPAEESYSREGTKNTGFHKYSDLISKLDALLPGTGMKAKLFASERLDYQRIADILASGGHLTGDALRLLKRSNIQRLDLSASLVGGRNRVDALCALRSSTGFRNLKNLMLDGAPIENYDLTHVHHLPQLQSINLCGTNIGNEAIYHIVALRSTLTQLLISGNSAIDDDAIPAIILLQGLALITLSGTGVTMRGLRRLVLAFHEHGHALDLEIPRACEQYLDDLQDQYLLDPRPPLITDPSICTHLTAAALKRNLTEHATCNPEIDVNGTKAQLTQRLEKLLRDRKADLLVREMARKTGDTEVQDSGETEEEYGSQEV